jgi:hypothetical protein
MVGVLSRCRAGAVTNRDVFSRLWKLIEFPNSSVWKEHGSSTEGLRRFRNALELLASVLWHLELASSFGDISDEVSEAHRHEITQLRGLPLPWKLWQSSRSGVTSFVDTDRLRVEFIFERPFERLLLQRPLQSTLIADAAMRLAGTMDVLASTFGEISPMFWKRKRWKSELNSAQPMSRFASAVLLITALRDRYMHGEMTKQDFPLAEFRGRVASLYSILDIYRACLIVWVELCKLCARGIRLEQEKLVAPQN